MAKTQQKTDLTLVDQEDPRVRMREIRSIVANALKTNQRLDLMTFSERDRTRVIVALQDEVMKARERHNRATKHICNARQDMELIMPVIEMSIELQGLALHKVSDELEIQSQRLEEAQEDCITLAQENADLKAALRVLR